MNFEGIKLSKALEELSNNYFDGQVNNNKKIYSMEYINKEFIRLSMKRSNIHNVTYRDCHIENNALTGSFFLYSHFINGKINGNSFANCDFYSTEFYSQKLKSYTSNNFSQTNFTKCSFSFLNFVSSSFLQTFFNDCDFDNVCFQSSTLEGSCFINCSISNSDVGSVNIEFVELKDTLINDVVFPFYQFPYIIGAVDYINDNNSTINLRISDRNITMKEYKNQLTNLIYYYYDKSDYFPMCNLQIAIGETEQAVRTLLNGIDRYLENLDFRMIRHLCRLAKHHDILDESVIKKISEAFDLFLIKADIPLEKINSCIIHIGEIRKLLLSGDKNSVTYNLYIRTNIDKSNVDGIEYVNLLCNELNSALATNYLNHNGFQVAISNHSPYEIMVEVLTNTANLVAIGAFVWHTIDFFKNKNLDKNELSKSSQLTQDEELVEIDTEMYRKNIDLQIELCKEKLLKLNNTYSNKKMNNYIEEVIQQLQTEIVELHDREIMLFIKKN